MRTILHFSIVLHDIGVALLRRAASGIADIREGLVAVQAAEFQRLAVEAEAFGVNSAVRKPKCEATAIRALPRISASTRSRREPDRQGPRVEMPGRSSIESVVPPPSVSDATLARTCPLCSFSAMSIVPSKGNVLRVAQITADRNGSWHRSGHLRVSILILAIETGPVTLSQTSR